MHILLAIIVKEIRALTRDIHGLMVLFVMPAIFILIMSLALKDVFSENSVLSLGYTVVNQDETPLAQAFIDKLAQKGYQYEALTGTSLAEIKDKLRLGELSFALVLKEGFAMSQVDFDERPERPMLAMLVDPGTNPAALAGFHGEVVKILTQQKMEILLPDIISVSELENFDKSRFEKLFNASILEVEYISAQLGQKPTSVQQSVPAWLVFSMFFVVIPISTIFIKERELGTLTRLSIMQVSGTNILLGKLVPFFVINQIQAIVMILVGIYLVPRFGGDALKLGYSLGGLWLMAAATSVAAIGFALFIAVIARTTEQATTLGGVSNIILGALGGIMVPKSVMPIFMQEITDFSPMAWALEGFLTILVRQGGIADVMSQVVALLLFAVTMLLLAGTLYRIKT